jgi:hypothetical protein
MVLKLFSIGVFALVPMLAGCPQQPTVGPAAAQCGECVGNDVLANYVSSVPLPFYPQLCQKMLADCTATCGSDIVTIISAVAGSQNAKVQATPAFAEAKARRAAMLASSVK